MAATPPLKLFNPRGEFVASFKYAEDAAALLAFYGSGATLRNGHAKKDTLFHEGHEELSAGESYDRAAEIIYARLHDALPHVTDWVRK